MGTMIQGLKLNEEGYRGARFDAWNREVRGNNDLLNLSRPDAVRDIHLAYFRAGADIVSTNTFSSTSIAQADYGMEGIAYELNQAGATLAREAAAQAEKEDGRRRFVAGALGPTNRTASISPDVANPGFRAITFDQLRAAYGEQVRGLIDGGADLLLIETIFDTLNAKAAIFAISEICEERGRRRAGDDLRHDHRPLRTPAVGPDAGRVLEFGQARKSGHHRPQLRARCARDARAYRRAWPAGRYLRLRLSERRPAERVRLLRREPGLHGGTPRRIRRSRTGEHRRRLLRHDARAHRGHRQSRRRQDAARHSRTCRGNCACRGSKSFALTPEIPFVNVGERTNVTGSAKFRKLITAGDYSAALSIAREQVENGAQVIDVNMDEGLLDSEQAMTTFLNLIAAEPDIARVPVMVDSSKFSVIEAGLKCLQGKPVVNSISLKEGEAGLHRSCPHRAPLRRRGGGDGVRRERARPTRSSARPRSASAPTTSWSIRSASRPRTSSSIRTSSPSRPAWRSTTATASPSSKRRDRIRKDLPHAHVSGGVSNLSFSFRGNERVREAMHSVFLFHAIKAGMDMGIVNAGQMAVYDDLDPELREACEDVVLNRRPDAAERLLDLAKKFQGAGQEAKEADLAWREQPVEKRLSHALVHGITDFIDDRRRGGAHCARSARST